MGEAQLRVVTDQQFDEKIKKSIDTMNVDELIEQFHESKQLENRAKNYRLKVEQKLAGMINLKAKGTTRQGALKVVTAVSESWDSDQLKALRNTDKPWPFDELVTYKPIKDGIAWTEANDPEYFNSLCQALTQKPKKPAFSIDLNRLQQQEE